MNRPVITSESFEELLTWLGPTRDEGGQKYETIRTRLIRIFIKKGFSDPEDLADTTINRVITKLPEIRKSYVGDPSHYFCGVARLVYLESFRRREIVTDSLAANPATESKFDHAHDCLRHCLSLLSDEQQNLVLDYYLDEKRAKIDLHRQLATELGLSANALRLRAHRIRSNLEKCVLQCVGEPTQIHG